MKVPIYNSKRELLKERELGFEVITDATGTHAVYEVVRAYLANQRSGTACTKTRGEVSGGGRKPWRQKGTGRARHGSIRSPIWVGGGIVFGPKPRDYSIQVPKKVKQLALRKALSERLKEEAVIVIDDIKFSEPKTKRFAGLLKDLGIGEDETVLVIHHEPDLNLLLSARNIPGVEVASGKEVNTYQILKYDKLIITELALAQIESRLNRD